MTGNQSIGGIYSKVITFNKIAVTSEPSIVEVPNFYQAFPMSVATNYNKPCGMDCQYDWYSVSQNAVT